MSSSKQNIVIQSQKDLFDNNLSSENIYSDKPTLELLKNLSRSPLRYPGGKSRAVKTILPLIPETEKELCSPFLGGASIELACTSRMKVYGSDVFEPLIIFWDVLLHEPEKLIERVQSYHPLSKTIFYNLQKRFINLNNKVEKAAAFFVLNRSSFSGTTLSGGMSPDHPRFTQSSIERLREFGVQNFSVECKDYRDAITEHKNAFLYLDPPYMIDQSLYGMKGNTHKGFDHITLAEMLLKRDRWVMSYNDCEEIRALYKNNTIRSVEWIYGMPKNKQSNEVIILSEDLAA